MKVIEFTNEKEYIKDFIKLPSMLYEKENNMEDPSNTKKFLLGTHPLSKYFNLNKYLVYEGNIVVGRFAITTYENDDNCYLGFYESINDKKVSKLIFDTAKKFCKKNKYKKIIGPVDGSFWNKYRMKINHFELRPYTSEPYNKEYYYDLFKDNGFKESIKYVSNAYKVVYDSYDNELFKAKYEKLIESGCTIITPKLEDYEKIIDELYDLLTSLYSDFPIYKNISKEDFNALFMSYKSILNMNMIRLSYYKDELVGFFISLPDYNNRVYHLNSIKNILEILKLKKKPQGYIMLYVGVKPEHHGLGSAMSNLIMEELRVSKLPSISALIKEGKVNQKYANDMIDRVYEYVLLEWSNK